MPEIKIALQACLSSTNDVPTDDFLERIRLGLDRVEELKERLGVIDIDARIGGIGQQKIRAAEICEMPISDQRVAVANLLRELDLLEGEIDQRLKAAMQC